MPLFVVDTLTNPFPEVRVISGVMAPTAWVLASLSVWRDVGR